VHCARGEHLIWKATFPDVLFTSTSSANGPLGHAMLASCNFFGFPSTDSGNGLVSIMLEERIEWRQLSK
jgi:hypothetical protein